MSIDGALYLGLYLLPAIVSTVRGHRAKNSIFLLNLLLGWTIIGWIIALIWAASPNVETARG